jgi:hypothetical protein
MKSITDATQPTSQPSCSSNQTTISTNQITNSTNQTTNPTNETQRTKKPDKPTDQVHIIRVYFNGSASHGVSWYREN